MILRKWNYKKRKYEVYETPGDWNCKTYSEDMEEYINCPHCGKKIKYGDSYTSLEIHTNSGLGYGVCEKCYENEWLRKRSSKENEL